MEASASGPSRQALQEGGREEEDWVDAVRKHDGSMEVGGGLLHQLARGSLSRHENGMVRLQWAESSRTACIYGAFERRELIRGDGMMGCAGACKESRGGIRRVADDNF